MLKKLSILITVAVVSFAASGCSSILIPYSSSYSCPESKGGLGNCNSLVKNYKNSFKNHPIGSKSASESTNCPKSLQGTSACSQFSNTTSAITGVMNAAKPMRQALLEKMLLSQPVPLRVPSVVKKALVMPYATKNQFHGFTEVYFVVSPGRWLMGNYLEKTIKTNNEFVIFKR